MNEVKGKFKTQIATGRGNVGKESVGKGNVGKVFSTSGGEGVRGA